MQSFGYMGLCLYPISSLVQLLELFQAVGADILALEVDDILSIGAEDAGRLVLFQDNGIALSINLDGISFGDVQGPAELNRDDQSSEVVKLSNDTSRFHDIIPFQVSKILVIGTFSFVSCRIITYGIVLSMQKWKFFFNFLSNCDTFDTFM